MFRQTPILSPPPRQPGPLLHRAGRSSVLLPAFLLRIGCWAILTFAMALPAAVHAWDNMGHAMVARLAWERLDRDQQKILVELLKEAPSDALLYQLYPDYRMEEKELDRIFFELAASWPDRARELEKYHRDRWHYVNRFWEQPDPALPPRDRWDLVAPPENIVSQLYRLERQLKDATRPKADRAIDLAWLLHLVGDVHQPLHCSSRVTKRRGERSGDRGGNQFGLAGVPGNDLHGFWDGILRVARPQRDDENYPQWLTRLSDEVRPGSAQSELEFVLPARLRPRDYQAWADEGHLLAKTVCYPVDLKRGRAPRRHHIEEAYEIARRRMYLAAVRLAEVLEAVAAASSRNASKPPN